MSDLRMTHAGKVPAACVGEKCGFKAFVAAYCGDRAMHKVGEEFLDETDMARHNMTQYVCCKHYGMIFGTKCQ